MTKNNNRVRNKITDIKINENSLKLYNVYLKSGDKINMSPSELANYINETELKNKKDKKIKSDE